MSRWIWVNEQLKQADGQLYWQPESLSNELLDKFVRGRDSKIEATVESPQTPDTLLWTLSVPVPQADGTTPGSSQLKLGRVLKSIKWFATCRLYSPWFIPRHGKGPLTLDKDAVEVAFLRGDGLSVVMLALSGINDTSMCFRNNDAGEIIINTRNDADKPAFGTIILAVAKSFDIANAAVLYHARKVSTSSSSDLELKLKELQINKTEQTTPNWYEEWVDGFGYCTWNSLGQGLTEERILSALEAFRNDDISSKWSPVII
jgi:hypothetical protein